MAFKLGYYNTCSPFRGSRIAFWRHHDAVFSKLCKDDDLEIHVILPVVGGSQYVEKLYRKGDKGVLYPTLRDMTIIFHEVPNIDLELDALYLDDIHTYQEVKIADTTCTVDGQRRFMTELIEKMISRNKPIVFSDTDGFCTEILEDTKAEMMDLFNTYKGYEKFKLTSPFHNPVHKNFYLIPFEVDPAKFQTVQPLSERNYMLRYVGNEYYREHFVPLFDKLSGVGRVMVNGAGWNKYKDQALGVEWKPKISMTPDGVNTVYGDSALGLTGRSSFNAKKGQEIYLYRWKEYLQAGTLIVPENLPSYTSKLPVGTLTADDILQLPIEDLSRILDMSDEEYKSAVTNQRAKALEFFGVDRWVPVFREMFEM